jgi:hypothetical protein
MTTPTAPGIYHALPDRERVALLRQLDQRDRVVATANAENIALWLELRGHDDAAKDLRDHLPGGAKRGR